MIQIDEIRRDTLPLEYSGKAQETQRSILRNELLYLISGELLFAQFGYRRRTDQTDSHIHTLVKIFDVDRALENDLLFLGSLLCRRWFQRPGTPFSRLPWS